MTDEKPISEKDAVLRERAAFLKGFNQGIGYGVNSPTVESHYPLPRVTRPRVVRDADGNEWGFRGSRDTALPMCKPVGRSDWINATDKYYPLVTRKVLTLLAGIIANPLETVEDDS